MAATLTENALQVLRARYLARDGGAVVETPAELFRRVARHVAAVERSYGATADEIEAVAGQFERRLAALEFLPNSPTLMNAGRPLGQLAACFVVPVDDSTTGVFEAVRWAAEIQKTGGGTGFSFSRLRPAGDLVASTGGTASGPVTLMQVFDVATEAIKQGGTRRGANMGMLRVDHPDILEFIAIKLDPARMRNFNLSVAATDAFMTAVAAGTSYDLVNPRTGAVTGRLDARRVFDAIANAAWAVGDPGLVFIDRVNELQPTPDRGLIEATNPCVVGDTRVWVEGQGLVEIRELVGKTPRIATHDGERVVFRRATQVVATGVRPVLRLKTLEGPELRLTADHRVATERGDARADSLEPGDRIRLIAPADGADVPRDTADARRGAALGRSVAEHGAAGRSVPASIRRGSQAVVAGFLRGLFAEEVGETDGDVRLAGELDFLRDVQQLVLRFGGMRSWICAAREHLGGQEHELVVHRTGGRDWVTVAAVEPCGEAAVFDLTEPTTGHFFANGMLVHNCGEQPLLPFESCTLGSIDVGRFVAGGQIEWGRLRGAIHESVRFLDDVIDANRYPLVEIEAATKATRKIGLGIMGWADALVALDLAYDSDAALELAGRLARFLEEESLRASEALAAARGPFPAWLGSRWERQGHRPLRNATTTTIAPTGTISIIAGCASGIEPLYALAYRRNVLDGAELSEINPAFRRIAEERGIDSPELLLAVAEHGGVRGVAGVPADIQRRFPTAHDVSIEMHVRMQAAFQRHVHAAVSKTINLRREATPGDVKAAYQLAYELGCKGITVYRDGSREGQVLVTGARVAVASSAPTCPECGSVLVVQSRCQLCRHCGWSVCSV